MLVGDGDSLNRVGCYGEGAEVQEAVKEQQDDKQNPLTAFDRTVSTVLVKNFLI